MIKTEIGEFIVGAYLKLVLDCDFVGYNVRPPGGGLRGLEEFDIVGLNFRNKTAYICEATTHITGLLYKNNKETILRIKKKHSRQKKYAKTFLSQFKKCHFMFWSPVVREGYVTEQLRKIKSLELKINGDYTECVNDLRKKAKRMTNDTGNPFFRMLQILEHLRK